MLWGMGNHFSSVTRDQTRHPVIEAWTLNHWTTREDLFKCKKKKKEKKKKKKTQHIGHCLLCSLLQLDLITILSLLTNLKAMAPHSSTLAWKIPWTEEPGRLQSMGLLRVGHDWATSLSLFTFMHWRRKWQPTPVLLPGESRRWGSLVGCHLWGRTESEMTEVA